MIAVTGNVDKRLTPDLLSKDQREVYNAILDWRVGGASLLTLGGLAGTGKTTVIGVLAAELQRRGALVAYVAYTGRAASILARKLNAGGVASTSLSHGERATRYTQNYGGRHAGPPRCSTLHSLLYRPILNAKEEVTGWARRTQLDRDYDLIVVDEASMIGDQILEDLRSFDVPLLAVGDHGQLPPVMAKGELMQHPELKLEKIHRQAEGSPIIKLAHHIRNEGWLHHFQSTATNCVSWKLKSQLARVVASAMSTAKSPLAVGLLGWRNKTRVMLNGEVRKAQRTRGAPKKGEVVICLKNKPPVYNGMRGIITADAIEPDDPFANPWELVTTIEFPDEELPPATFTLCAPQFNREKTFAGLEEIQSRMPGCESFKQAGDFFDFGYAMTVHKAQGSSFEHAIIYLDRDETPWDEDWRRWMYTAVTRSSERLTVLL